MQADDAGDAVAVALELGEVEVAVALEIHRHAVDHRLEMLFRQRDSVATTGCSACATGCCGVPVNAAPISLRHHASFVRATAGVGHLVDDVVDLAAERVQRGDRAAPRRGGRNRKL